MKKSAVFVAVLFMLACAPKAFAASESVWEMANSPVYGKKMGGMLGRGVVNVATCFVDLIVQTVNGTQDGPPFVGSLTGLGSGLACSALRVSSGALDVVTFWVPGFNGIPVSRSYANCLEVDEATSDASAAPSYAAPATDAPAAAERQVNRSHNAMDYVKK